MFLPSQIFLFLSDFHFRASPVYLIFSYFLTFLAWLSYKMCLWLILFPSVIKLDWLQLLLSLALLVPLFPTAPTMSAVGKEPHLSFSSFSFFIFRGPLLDWLWQIMLHSHWSTQTWRSTNACVPATDEAVYLLNLAMQGLTERCRTQIF